MEIPHDQDYHLFAMVPHIVNPKVVHHIELYDCPEADGNRFFYTKHI